MRAFCDIFHGRIIGKGRGIGGREVVEWLKESLIV
jgi:hypothetical protein